MTTADGKLDLFDGSDPTMNSGQAVFSANFNPISSPVGGVTTPTTFRVFVGNKYDTDKAATGAQPGHYEWPGMFVSYQEGTAPLTALMARGRGNTLYTLSSSGRVYGPSPTIHGLEITCGVFNSAYTVTADGSNTVTVTAIREENSLVGVGMTAQTTDNALPGPNNPLPTTPYTTVVSYTSPTNRPGNPDTITLSNAVSAGTKTLYLSPDVAAVEAVGCLVTGNGGAGTGSYPQGIGVPGGVGYQLQAYSDDARWSKGYNLGSSSLLPTGKGFVAGSLTASRILTCESCTTTSAVKAVVNGTHVCSDLYSGGTYSGPLHSLTGALSARTFATFGPGLTFTDGAALLFDGQSIGFSAGTGGSIGRSYLDKISFYGKATRVTRPAAIPDPSGGTTVDNEARAQLIALLNALRSTTTAGLGLIT